jgi:hypothetical protein
MTPPAKAGECETPKCDAFIGCPEPSVSLISFARTLERETIRLQQELKAARRDAIIKFIVQMKSGDNWIDWSEKESETDCLTRVKVLNGERPSIKFRAISRTITDTAISQSK